MLIKENYQVLFSTWCRPTCVKLAYFTCQYYIIGMRKPAVTVA